MPWHSGTMSIIASSTRKGTQLKMASLMSICHVQYGPPLQVFFFARCTSGFSCRIMLIISSKKKKNRIMLISSSNLGVQHPNQFVFQFVPIIISNPATDRLRHPVLLVVLVPFWRLSEQKNFLSVLYHFQLQLLQMLATYPPNMFTFFISHHQTAQTTHRRIMNGMTQGRFGLPKNVLFFSSIPFFLRKK